MTEPSDSSLALAVHGDEPSATPRRADAAYTVLAVLTFFAVLFQNFFRLGTAPPLYDEALYVRMGWLYVHWGQVSAVARAPRSTNFEHPPLAKLMFGIAQLMVGHPSLSAARAVSATAAVGVALTLAIWLGSVAGRWIGLLAGGMSGLLPMTVLPSLTRVGRAAMLDSVAVVFVVLTLALSWYWFTSSGRRAWVYTVAAGVTLGLATAARENAFLILLGPLVLGLWWSRSDRRRLFSTSVQVVAAITLSLVTFVATYLPFGDPIGRVRYLVSFLASESGSGHLIGLAGFITTHPPWWANLWFAGQGVGSLMIVCLPLAALAALVLRRDRLTWWLVASLVAPFLFHCFVAGMALPYYWTMWFPPLVALSALGLWELGARVLQPDRARIRRAGLAAAVVVGASAVVLAVAGQAWAVATLRPVGPQGIAEVREQLGLTGTILTAGTYTEEIKGAIPGARILTKLPADLTSVDTVVIGQPRCRTLVDPAVRALVAVNVASGALRLVRTDRLDLVYAVQGLLRAPSAAEVAAEDPGSLVDHC